MDWNTEHRSWPPPDRPWAMAMRWHDLLFMHWPIDPGVLAGTLPEGLPIDTYDGRAWLGVVPFVMTGVRARCTPALPGVLGVWAFAELNVRTYVCVNGRPGVYFFSLDAASRVAVRVARAVFGLPYFDARMAADTDDDGWVNYESSRTHRHAKPAHFKARYRPVGDPFSAEPGSLDHFLTERYYLYTVDRHGAVRVGDIHHAPWALQRAEAEVVSNTMVEPLGLTLPDVTPRLLFARRLEVVGWLPRRV